MIEVLKNRNERKAFFLSKNALKQAKRQAKKKHIATAAYLTLQMWNLLQIEAKQNLFVWWKLKELQTRAQTKKDKKG